LKLVHPMVITRRQFLGGLAGAGALVLVGCQPLALEEPPRLLGTSSRRVWAFSDSHLGLDGKANADRDGADWMELAIKDVRDNVGTVDYVLPLGDITDRGQRGQLARYAEIKQRSGLGPWYELVGNHDFAAVPAGLWRRYVRRPLRYSLVDGNAAWVFLSSEQGKSEGRISKASAQWLLETVTRHQDKNVIVCSHQAVYDTVSGSKGGETYIEHRLLVARVLQQARVDLWLCGHIHGGRRNAGYIARRGSTAFINVAALGRAYGTGACTSFVLEMDEGATAMRARCRDHEQARYLEDLSAEVDFPRPWRFSSRPQVAQARVLLPVEA
jgi:DNA repair exonuclease SbcCD nuclease subunit